MLRGGFFANLGGFGESNVDEDGRRREVKRLMKHVKVLSTEKPVQAQEVAWVQLKDIIGTNKAGNPALNPQGNMSIAQTRWLAAQIDMWLQK
jgi:hypothetical protein